MTAPAKEKKKPSFIYAASTFVLVLAVVLGGYYFLGIGLEVMFLFSWLLVFPACMKLGCSYGELEQGAFEFIKKGMGPVLLSLVVGGTISTWIGAGTVPAIIYYGLCYLKPGNFLLVAFVLSLALSLACGTAWGTMGTIGIAMFAVGQSFQVPAALTVGALLDIGVYPLTYLYRLFGKPEKILCEGRVEDGIHLSEEVSLTYAGGQTFTASISMDNAACGEYLLLTGDRGHVECAGFHAANEAQLVCRNGETEVFEGFGGRRNQFDLVAREIRAGLMESRYIPPAATIAVMEIMDECRRQMNLVYPFERD